MNNPWEILGIAFGYPTCCIEYFNNNAGISDEWMEYTSKNPFSGTGYIACPACSQKVVETLSYIKVHRHKDLGVFPYDESEEVIDKILEDAL